MLDNGCKTLSKYIFTGKWLADAGRGHGRVCHYAVCCVSQQVLVQIRTEHMFWLLDVVLAWGSQGTNSEP